LIVAAQTLAIALMRDYPKEYILFATRSFKFRSRKIAGHNNLMYRYKGMDGIKTGYTNASGFNLVSAVNDNGRHVVGVVLGGKSARSRDDRMAALLDKTVPGPSIRNEDRTRLVRNRTLAEIMHVFRSLPPAPNVRFEGETHQ
jgi:D-alanyl-D-alanine carboxypeptidase (penicillin-binding protein 5/6)